MANRKIFKKINIIDIIVIVTFLLFVVCGIYKLFFQRKPDLESLAPEVKAGGQIIRENVTAEVSYRIKNIRGFFKEDIKEGMYCYHTDGRKAGRIKNVTFEKYYEYRLNEEGKYLKYQYDDKYTVTFDIVLNGHYTRSAFNGDSWNPIGVGTVQYYELNGICFECEAIDVKVIYLQEKPEEVQNNLP